MFDINSKINFDDELQSDDIEALQTDTMRFLAILAICLMVIFALVQAVPFKPPIPPTLDESHENRIKELEKRIKALSLLEEALRTKINDSKKRLNNNIAQYAEAETALKQIRNELEEEKIKLNSLKKEINKYQSLKEDDEKKFANINKKIDDRSKTLDKIQEKIHNLMKKGVLPEVPKLTQEQEKVGFSITFDSGKALKHLIKTKRISFYAKFKERLWILQIVGNDMRYEEIHQKIALYKMANDTVPGSFKEAITKKVVSFSKNSFNYYVALPKDILSKINQQMSNTKGGVLVITTNGNVVLKK